MPGLSRSVTCQIEALLRDLIPEGRIALDIRLKREKTWRDPVCLYEDVPICGKVHVLSGKILRPDRHGSSRHGPTKRILLQAGQLHARRGTNISCNVNGRKVKILLL